jgi:hypothetical protein
VRNGKRVRYKNVLMKRAWKETKIKRNRKRGVYEKARERGIIKVS